MKIEFDPDKDASNWRKHGLSLAEAEAMDFDTAIYVPDDRYDYGEDRTQALGLIGGRLHMLVSPSAAMYCGRSRCERLIRKR